ncbi:MAG: glycerophosphodiester phosphodiesterase [Paracoccaceae bacterium]
MVRFLLLSAATFVAGCIKPLPDHPALAKVDGQPLIIAHNGGDGLRPANTMEAFRAALNAGANVLEFDVHASRDGVLVAIHDETLDRTTEASDLVKDRTFEELETLDAGYNWPTLREPHHPIGHPWRDQGLKIPAVDEVLRTFLDARFAIEIKQTDPQVTAQLCELLRKNNAELRSIISAFDLITLDDFRSRCPEVATSTSRSEDTRTFGLNLNELAGVTAFPYHAVKVPEQAQGLPIVMPSLLASARARNIDVHVGPVNEPDDMRRLIDLGVDGIITDYPDRMAKILTTEPEVSSLSAPRTE